MSDVDVRNLPVTLQIGKRGVTEGLLKEIDLQLKKRRFVKIKLLRSFAEEVGRKEAAEDLAQKTQSIIVAFKGFILVLFRGNVR